MPATVIQKTGETPTVLLKKSLTVEELTSTLGQLARRRFRPTQKISIELISGKHKIGVATRRQSNFDPYKAGEKIIEKLKIAENGAWTGKDLEQSFDLSAAFLHRKRKEHRIVFWRDAKHDFHYPKWQFTETGAMRAGVEDLLKIFKSDDEWRLMKYFLNPRKQLGNLSPLTLLQEGRKDEVLAHAKAHAEENTW